MRPILIVLVAVHLAAATTPAAASCPEFATDVEYVYDDVVSEFRAAIPMMPADGSCPEIATDVAYVYDGVVSECRAAIPVDIPEKPWIHFEAVHASLKADPISLVTVLVSRRFEVGKCNPEGCLPVLSRWGWKDETPTEHTFQLDGECYDRALDAGEAARLFAVPPCCDPFPGDSARCALEVPLMLDVPEWMVYSLNAE